MVNFDEILESGEVVEETPPTIQEPLDIDDIINNGEVVENTPAPKDISNETIAGIRDTRDLDQAMRVSKGNLSWALNVTQDIQPEKAREIESIAKSLKMPSTTVESDLEMARKYKRNKEIVDNIFKVDKDIGPLNPATLQFFTDPNNARLYKDEAERMVEIESIAKNHSKKLRDENSGVLTNFGKSALSGSLELVKGALLFPKFFSDRLKIQGEELEDQRQQLFQEIGVDIKQPKGGKIIEAIDSIMPTTPTGLATQIAGRNIIEATNKSINYLTDELINGQLVDYAQKVGSVATNINPEQATRSITRLIGDGRYKDAIETTFLQAAGSIPSMVLMGVAGVNGLSAIGGVTAADEYNIAVEEGVDGKTAMAVGTIKGGAEAIFELPTLSLLNAFKKTIAGEVAKRGGKEVAKRIAKSFLSEGSSEAATTVTQNLADLLTDREVKPLDVTLQAIDAFIVGGFVGTAVGSLTESVNFAIGKQNEIRQKREAESFKDMLGNTNELIKPLKDKGMSNEQIASFLDASTSKDDKSIYIDPEDLDTFLQEEGDEGLIKELGLEEQVEESKETGVPIEINRADFLSKYNNSEIFDRLQSKLKETADSLSMDQSKASAEEIRLYLSKNKERQVKDDIEIKKQTTELENTIQVGLLESGRGRRESHVSSKVLSSMLNRYAERANQGETGADVFNRIGLDFIKAEDGGKARGSITLNNMENVIIKFFKKANKSTSFHEYGHLGLKLMEDMTKLENVDPAFAEDWNKISEFLGLKDATEMTVEQNEKFARAFERYLMEGKAPNEKLQDAFRSIKDWMTSIYKSFKGLNVEMNDDIRSVFDRMLATQEEIDFMHNVYQGRGELRKVLNLDEVDDATLKKKKRESKLTAEELLHRKYMNNYLESQGGKTAIIERVSEEVGKDPFYLKLEEIKKDPIDARDLLSQFGPSTTMKILREHKDLFVGLNVTKRKDITTVKDLVRERGKISRASLTDEQYKILRENGGGGSITSKGGIPLDVMAEELQANNEVFFTEVGSKESQLYDMISSETELDQPISRPDKLTETKDVGQSLDATTADLDYFVSDVFIDELLKAKNAKNEVNSRVEAQMKQAEQNITKGLENGQLAEESFHNDPEVEFLLAEANMLIKKMSAEEKRKATKVDKKALRDEARSVIYSKNITKAGRYDLYGKTEQKYANQAYEYASKGNWAKALEAKRKQIFNHVLVQEAVKARDLKKKIEKNYKSKTKVKNALGNMEFELKQKAIEVLNRFGFSNLVPHKDFINKRLGEVNDALIGLTPEFMDSFRSEKGYRDLTMDQFVQFDQAMKSIYKLGRSESEALKETKYADGKALLEETLNLNENRKVLTKVEQENLAIRAANWSYEAVGKAEFIIRKLDRNISLKSKRLKMGPLETMFQTMFKSEVSRRTAFSELMTKNKESFETLAIAAKRITSENRKVLKSQGVIDTVGKAYNRIRNKNQYIEIEGIEPTEAMKREGMGFTSERVVSIMLNMGNAQNIFALEGGYDLTFEKRMQIAKMFTAKELKAFQQIWDMIDTLYPQISKKFFDRTNSKMGRVEAQQLTVESKDGKTVTLKGGYYPLSYDGRLSPIAQEIEAKELDRQILEAESTSFFRKSKVNEGFTKDRVAVSSLPPKLSLGVLHKHLDDTHKYIYQADSLALANQVIRNKSFRDMVKSKYGDSTYKILDNWLTSLVAKDVAKDTTLDSIINTFRNNATGATLALNAAVGLKQRLSMIGAFNELGSKYAMMGFKEAGIGGSVLPSESNESYKFVIKNSKAMRERAAGGDVDIRRATDSIKGVKSFDIAGKKYTMKDVSEFIFKWIQLNDRAAVVPLWLGAYSKYMDVGSKEGLTDAQVKQAAIDFADKMIRTTQPSSFDVDLANIQSSRNAFFRIFSMFQTWRNLFANRIMEVYSARKEGDITNKEAFDFFLADIVIASAGNTAIGALWVGGELPEWSEIAMDIPLSIMSGFPVADQTASVIKYRAKFGESTAFLMFNRGATAAKSTLSNKDVTDILMDYALFVDSITGVPVGSAAKGIKRQVNKLID